MSSVKQMDRKEFVLFISVPHKFFKPKPVHRCNQLALTLTLSKKVKNTSGHQAISGV
jgi:hypothetical protein